MADRDPRLQRGVELFHAGLYYEAHEVLEEAWNHAARRERFFVQSLVHCAVAWHHATHGNFEGAVSQARRAMRKLAGYLPEHGGIQTRALLADLNRWMEAWQRGAAAPRATIGVRR
jgi:predicted metal-dependent hydrolase